MTCHRRSPSPAEGAMWTRPTYTLSQLLLDIVVELAHLLYLMWHDNTFSGC